MAKAYQNRGRRQDVHAGSRYRLELGKLLFMIAPQLFKNLSSRCLARGKKEQHAAKANPHPAPPRLRCQRDGVGEGEVVRVSMQRGHAAMVADRAARTAGGGVVIGIDAAASHREC